MKLTVNVYEITNIIKEIQEYPGRIFDLTRFNVRKEVGGFFTQLMESELTLHLGRGRYERSRGNPNHRNGSYRRLFTIKGIGTVEMFVPRDRNNTFQTQVLPKSKQYEASIREDLSLMFLTGISTRSLSMISKKLLGRSLSHQEVSKAGSDLIDAVENWRNRDLSRQEIKYLFLDGVTFDMRITDTIEKVPVLVAIGVTKTGHKLVLSLQAGDKESASNWREFFKDLKKRGLNGRNIKLGVMDGLPGLEKVFKQEFSKSKVQRCQVHVAKNVLSKVPKKVKKEVADDIRSILYASSRKKALSFFEEFKNNWKEEIPSAVRCLESSLDACLTFFDFPDEEWISLRTTNIIERLNKEFKRRTKPMEIVAGENSCYRLLAFISLKMELHWRANPIGKVKPNLPLLKKFTQKY